MDLEGIRVSWGVWLEPGFRGGSWGGGEEPTSETKLVRFHKEIKENQVKCRKRTPFDGFNPTPL